MLTIGRTTEGILQSTHMSRFPVLIGRLKIWSMTIWRGVIMGLPVICVMGGRNNRIIRCSIKPISVRIRIVGKGHVQITTLKRKGELLILLWPPNSSNLCLKIESFKAFSKTQYSRLALSQNLSSRKSARWYTKSRKQMARSQFQKQLSLHNRNFQVKKN